MSRPGSGTIAAVRLVTSAPKHKTFDIKTVFYSGKKVVRINHAAHANSAVPRCVYHMQLDRYQAKTAEVFDENTGMLHAVITRSIAGNINIVFKREVKENM